MTRIKLCGISRNCDIEIINQLEPEFIGFVFAKQSKRYVSPAVAAELKKQLSERIQAVGVFVDQSVEEVATMLNEGTIDMVQLHGTEDEAYIHRLRELSNKTIIKAFRMDRDDMERIQFCSADYVLLDSGAGSGECFDWSRISQMERPFFLAGGLTVQNVAKAIKEVQPFAVDVSSGIETDGYKDKNKMFAFVQAVRELEQKG